IFFAAGGGPPRVNEMGGTARRAGGGGGKGGRRAFGGLAGGAKNQGGGALIAARRREKAYGEGEGILGSIGGHPPGVLVVGVEDPHNLGAILRTCECAGVDGVFIPEHRAAGLNETVAKTSAGAVEYVRVARVNNLVPLIDELKDRSVWVVGVEGGTGNVYSD